MEIRLESKKEYTVIESGDVVVTSEGEYLQFLEDEYNYSSPVRMLSLKTGKIINGMKDFHVVYSTYHIKEIIKFKDLILTRKDVE